MESVEEALKAVFPNSEYIEKPQDEDWSMFINQKGTSNIIAIDEQKDKIYYSIIKIKHQKGHTTYEV